jgi:undecaprenyl-diphosphatase
LTLFVVIGTGILLLRGERRSVAVLLSAVAIATITSLSLKAGFDRPRPDLVPHGSFVSNASFPSGHSLSAAAVYLTLGLIFARLNAHTGVRVFIVGMAILLTGLVGVSRVYLGVHWPTDVLAGWSVGAAIALIFTAFARRI